jgi:hypothetical protein
MTPCKFQSDHTGKKVLVYSEDKATVVMEADGEIAAQVRDAVGLPSILGKRYAMAK